MHQNPRDSVRSAILSALARCCPSTDPFLVLREAGVVAEIRSKINHQFVVDGITSTCCAHISQRTTKPRYDWSSKQPSPGCVRIDRVQLELKAVPDNIIESEATHLCQDLNDLKKPEPDRVTSSKYRTDIVVLKDRNVRIFCANNGPGDVIASVPISSILCCIEVKASPSVDPGQVQLYGEDIDALLHFLEESNDKEDFAFLGLTQGHFS